MFGAKQNRESDDVRSQEEYGTTGRRATITSSFVVACMKVREVPYGIYLAGQSSITIRVG